MLLGWWSSARSSLTLTPSSPSTWYGGGTKQGLCPTCIPTPDCQSPLIQVLFLLLDF